MFIQFVVALATLFFLLIKLNMLRKKKNLLLSHMYAYRYASVERNCIAYAMYITYSYVMFIIVMHIYNLGN